LIETGVRMIEVVEVKVRMMWMMERHHVYSTQSGQCGYYSHVHHRFRISLHFILRFLFPPRAGEESTDEEDDKDSTEDENEGDVGSTAVGDAIIMKTKIQVVICKMIRNIFLGIVITKHCHSNSEISIFILVNEPSTNLWNLFVVGSCENKSA